ncbi:NACHT domain-containing protein [Actinoplanes bogorensis]|uniref:NACHT domain-containing protein n=1 Tax=Paractinoplanes bogorensis TaxID=1610840 RepID=A0ABS5YLN2_9ACTN|nr:NACHT domain-containing protein [Actinoplanes bogorensis]MBU2664342.1 NACHT domain-containing protein [Actinoplanes bogorensis]
MTRKAQLWVMITGLVTVVGGVAINQVLSPDGKVQWMWLAGAVLVTAGGGWLVFRMSAPPTTLPVATAEVVEQTLAALAARVEAVWKPEQSARRLLNPRPLPTAWTIVGPPGSDHWGNIRSDGINQPLDLPRAVETARPDAFERLVTDPRLRGRVVLLGEPGAGKTALLLRLTLVLLADRKRTGTAGAPVPVLLRLSTWNPQEKTLEQWIAWRLMVDYGFGRAVPTDHLIPLLDGLDEVPDDRRRQALLAIGDTFTETSLVVSCRTAEYHDSLAALAGNVLAAAVVAELTALRPDAARDYLELTTSRPEDWRRVFDQDDGRVTAALSAPLWVDLARTTYTDPDQPDNDPGELLDLADADSVRARLLDRLIPSAYPEPARVGPDGHTWRRDEATRWLRFLAATMRADDTQDITWWDFAFIVPRWVRFAYGLTAGALMGLSCGLAGGTNYGGLAGLLIGVLAGLAFGTAVGLEPPSLPSRRIRWRMRTGEKASRRARHVVSTSLSVTLTYGLVLGAIIWLLLDRPFEAVVTVVVWFVFGLLAGVVREFTTYFAEGDADVSGATDPVGLMRDDRRRAVAMAIAGGTVIFGSTSFFVGVPTATVMALLSTVGIGLGFGAFGKFELARLWCGSHGWLPWRTTAFLVDAHRRGVLRQAGGVWQFRHAVLRDRLAAASGEHQSEVEPA